MTNPVIQTSFASGELSPSLYGRVDLAKYHTGVALARNMFVDYRGGLSTRTGTAFVGQCKDSSTPNRLIPFQFSTVQTYALVFGNFTMRVVMNGAYVTEPATTISAIIQASPGVLTDTAHGYSTGDLVFLSGIAGMTQLNGRFGIVQKIDANTYSLLDMYGLAINTTAYGTYISGGTAARVFTLVTPYAAADLALLKFSQSDDTMNLTHPNYAPQVLTRTQHWVWTINVITFVPTTATPTSPAVTGAAGPIQYKYVVTAVGANGVTESLASAQASILSVPLSTTVNSNNVVSWTGTASDTLYNIYRTPENLAGSPAPGALFGYVGSVVPASPNNFIDNNIQPDFTRSPPQGNNPFSSGNNPICSTYYQQRLVFGGQLNNPDALNLSRTADYYNFSYSTPSRDDDSIAATLASQVVNPVKFVVPLTSLIVLTASGCWRVDGGGSSAITPSTIDAVPQAYNGCGEVPPIVINYDILYVQAKGAIVRDLSYNFYVNIYTGNDISMLSSHLFLGHQILEWAWAEEPYRLVWAVREDGILLCLTFLKEQEVYGWTRHDTLGLFKSVCSISEGEENSTYVIVERLINGQYLQYIERFASRNMGGDPAIGIPGDVTRAWCVDAGLQYLFTYPAATLTPTEPTNVPLISSVAMITGGSGYSAPTVSVTDPTGVGAAFSATVVGGVITAISVTNQGANYTNPVLTITDSTGSGAVASAVVTEPVPMNASAAIFSSANIGSVVRINGGVGVVASVPSASQIIVNVSTALNNVWPAAQGSWTMTAPVTTINGLDHLNGQTVSILADGNVQPQQTVVAGSITLQEAASAITIGLPFVAQMQSLYLDVPAGPGTIQSKRKRISAVTVRTENTRGLKVGPNFNSLVEFKERTTETMGQPIALYTGDRRIIIDPIWTEQGQLCFQQDQPLPATVLALVPEINIGDT